MSVCKQESRTSLLTNSKENDSFESCMKNIIESSEGLCEQENLFLKAKLEKIEQEIKNLEDQKLQLGRLLDYDILKKKGFSGEEIKAFATEDSIAITMSTSSTP